MIFNQSDKNYYFKLKQKWFLNKSKRIFRFLYLNDDPINIPVRWLKTKKDIKTHLACWQNFNYDVCFLITNRYKFNTENFLCNIDIVLVDLSYNVIKIWNNIKPNTELEFRDHFGHLFIFCANSTIGHGIKLNSRLFTARR